MTSISSCIVIRPTTIAFLRLCNHAWIKDMCFFLAYAPNPGDPEASRSLALAIIWSIQIVCCLTWCKHSVVLNESPSTSQVVIRCAIGNASRLWVQYHPWCTTRKYSNPHVYTSRLDNMLRIFEVLRQISHPSTLQGRCTRRKQFCIKSWEAMLAMQGNPSKNHTPKVTSWLK